jgi:hypothetical protein
VALDCQAVKEEMGISRCLNLVCLQQHRRDCAAIWVSKL